jgi:glycerate kinase
MANSVGIELLSPDELDALKSSSYGVGIMMKDAFKKKVAKIVLFVGGSATNDMGVGAAQALGVSFITLSGKDKILRGNDVGRIKDYIIPDYLHTKSIVVATDVTNPLYGPAGASMVYGPQKGGDHNQIQFLDQSFRSLASLVQQKTGTDLQNLPGSGAAGGIAGGMVAFGNGKIVPGAKYILDLLKVEYKISEADLLITGEGKMDHQTLHGKLISKLSEIAQKFGVPICAVCGNIELNHAEKEELGIIDDYSIKKWTNNAAYTNKSTIFHLEEIGEEIGRKYLRK